MRPLPALAAVLAALALLAGCGGDDDETTSSTTTAETTSTAATGPTGPEGAEDADPPAGTGGEGDGGDGGGASQGAGSDPEGALEAFFTSGDPDVVCGELATPELLANAYGDERGCRQAQVPDAVPKSIEIKELETDGDETEAVIVPEGGPNDGFDHDVVLVREGDTWLVDSIETDIPAGP
jgi:hypothetical protein